MKPEREGVETFHLIWCTNSLYTMLFGYLVSFLAVVREHRVYV